MVMTNNLHSSSHITQQYAKPLLGGRYPFSASVALAVAASISCGTHADSIGVFAGANAWQQDFDGYVSDLDASSPVEVNFQDDLGLEENDSNVIYVSLEHPIPFLPNLQLKRTTIEIDGANTLNRQIEYGGETFNVSTSIVSEADLSHTDVTAYYQILDNYVSLDVGMTARFFDGFVEVQDSTGAESGRVEFDSPVPLLFVKARADLPLTGAYVSITGNALGDGDNNFTDMQGTIGWESQYGLGVEAGYRVLEVELEDLDDVNADLTIDGAFAGLMYHF